MAKDKNLFGFKSTYLMWHIIITFFTALIFSLRFNFIFGAFVIAGFHFFIDGLKKSVMNTRALKNNYFFVDQTLHLLIITGTVLVYNNHFNQNPLIDFSGYIKSIAIVAGYVVCTKPANIIIKEIIKAFEVKINNSEDDELPNAGKLIGIIERFLVFTFVILGQFEAVGFLLAAKSILRFKEDNTIKAEYVLIGTMLSFGIAILMGVIITKYF